MFIAHLIGHSEGEDEVYIAATHVVRWTCVSKRQDDGKLLALGTRLYTADGSNVCVCESPMDIARLMSRCLFDGNPDSTRDQLFRHNPPSDTVQTTPLQ